MAFKFNPFTGKLDIAGSAGGGSPTGPAGGDLAGTYPNPTVDGLQGRPVSNATPVNGQVLQYDGTNWVPGSIPSGGSGGGGVVYYLNFNTAADTPLTNIPQTPNATKELGLIGDVTATSYLSPILSTGSYNFLASFVTDVSTPSSTAIPAGIWDFNIFVESTTTNSANQVYFKIEILKYDGVNAPTLLATSNDTYIYDPSEITQQVASVVMPQTTILSTDRIVVYLYGRAHQNNNRLTFHFGGQYPSHTHSTMPSVTGTGVVKVVNGVFQSPATTIVDADVSATAAIGVSKLAMSTNRILGRTTAGTGAVEEISVGTGLSLSAGTLTNTGISGSVGAVDNSVLRADVGTGIVQNSSIIIDDETTTTQNNVAIRNNDSQTNSALVLTPKGTGAFILGPKPDGAATGGNARGSRAVDLQTSRSTATQVASGSSSFVHGIGCTASFPYAIAIGVNASATADRAVAIGGGLSGGIVASATNAHAYGLHPVSDRYGMDSRASGKFITDGDAQRARFVLRCKTTTNTGVEMALDGATTYLGIPSGKYLTGTINIAGIKSDGSATASYIRQFSIKNVAATTTLVGTVNTIGIDTASLTSISITANDASDYLSVQVTGIASETWRWVASVDVVEVAYGA